MGTSTSRVEGRKSGEGGTHGGQDGLLLRSAVRRFDLGVNLFLFYLDESGNTGFNLDSTVQPIHWLVALCLTPSGVRSVEDAMASIAQRYFPTRSRQPDFEFHGSDLFAGRGDSRDLSPTQRVSLYGELLRLVPEHDVKVFIRGIHKERHRDRARHRGYSPDHPHRLGFMYLVERLDEWLEAQQPAEGTPPLYGLLVADEQREMNREIVESFAFWRDHGTDHGYRNRDILYFIDCVHYVPSHDNWLIQLADCVAFMRNRYARIFRERGPDESAWGASDRAVVRLWRDHCVPCLIDNRAWP